MKAINNTTQELSKAQIISRKHREYYQKNKELYKERVRQQREEKKAKQQNLQSTEQLLPSPFIQNTIIDFLIWTKRMTYVTVDIRDTTGEFVWNGIH